MTYMLWIRILSRSPLNSANAFLFLVPLLGVMISAVFLGERIGPLTVLGMGLAIGGVVLASRGGQEAPTEGPGERPSLTSQGKSL